MFPAWFSTDPGRWLLGFVAAACIAVLAHRARALSHSGALGAALVGTILVGGGGWWAGALLVAFFVTSSTLSLVSKGQLPEQQERGSQRDLVQVLANGGVATLCAAALALDLDPTWAVALAAAIAAANADTWATEIGRLSGQRPRSIITWRSLPAGTSGAISFAGTMAAFIGATLIAILAVVGWQNGWLVNPGDTTDLARLLMIVVGSGWLGSIIDSLLGATVQGQFHCPTCDVHTEMRRHTCGTATTRVRGLPWSSNDVVNVLAVASAAAIAFWFARLLH